MLFNIAICNYISNVRTETFSFQKNVDNSEETKIFTMSSCPSKLTHDHSTKEDTGFGDHIHKILIVSSSESL